MTESKKYVPFVSPDKTLPEFTVRALVIGLIMCVVLGAANAYLGLKAGMTIARLIQQQLLVWLYFEQ